MMIDINEWVQQNRKEKLELFGEIGLHEDCVNFSKLSGKPLCHACTYYTDGHKIVQRNTVLQCEKKVCYFYEPKRKENNDGND